MKKAEPTAARENQLHTALEALGHNRAMRRMKRV